MSRTIDCVLVGHNQVEFARHEEQVRRTGMRSPAYRDLGLNFIKVGGKPMTLGQLWNAAVAGAERPHRPLRLFDNFSATLAYLGSFLDAHGASFDYVESFQDEKDRLRTLLTEHDVVTVGVTTTYYTQAEPVVEIVSFIREVNPRVRVVVGGPYVTTQTRGCSEAELHPLLDYIGADVYVNSSQGEASLVALISALKHGRSLSSVENLILKANGRWVQTPRKIEDNDLAANRIRWGLFADHLDDFANIRTAVSCPFSCAFCSFPAHAGKYKYTAVEVLERELDELAAIGKVRGLLFVDDTLNVPPSRFVDTLRMMIRKQYGFRWFGNIRSQYLDEESVALMKEAGCSVAFLGIESGSDAVLKKMNKRATVAQYAAGIRLLREAGITTFGSFVVGFPGETHETVDETIRFIDETGIDFFRANLWYCERITPVWNDRLVHGLHGEAFDWRHRTMTSEQGVAEVERIFETVTQSVWLPIVDFDIVAVWQALCRGYSRASVKALVRIFNRELRAQRIARTSTDSDPAIAEELASCLDGAAREKEARTARQVRAPLCFGI